MKKTAADLETSTTAEITQSEQALTDNAPRSIEDYTQDQLAFTSPEDRFECTLSFIKGLVIRYLRNYSERLLNDNQNLQPSRPSGREVLHLAGIAQNINGDTSHVFPDRHQQTIQLGNYDASHRPQSNCFVFTRLRNRYRAPLC